MSDCTPEHAPNTLQAENRTFASGPALRRQASAKAPANQAQAARNSKEAA